MAQQYRRVFGQCVKAGTAVKLASMIVLFPHLAFGQDAAILKQRVERLERDISTLSRQVYRGGASTGANGATGYPPATLEPARSDGYNEALETRIDTLEQSIRSLTGQMETIRHDVDVQGRKIDRALGDIDFRFQQISKSAPASTASAPNEYDTPATTDVAGDSQSGRLRPGVIDNVTPRKPEEKTAQQNPTVLNKDPLKGKGSNVLATVPTDDAEDKGDVKNKTQMASVTLPEGGLQEQYDFAFGLLKNFEFDKAEGAFKQFLQKNGSSKLAPNAQYWLAESYYGRNDYKNSALAFAESYKKYPTGPKGPDSLLKLGMSLGRLGQKAEACLSLDRLKQEYPSAAPAVLQVADQEKKSLACTN